MAQRIDVPEHQVALKILPRSLYVGRNVDRELVMLAGLPVPVSGRRPRNPLSSAHQ